MVFTLILVALFVMTLALWERNGNVSHSGKIWFNVIATVLNLALGLNFLEAFKDMAKVLRWRVLANRPFTVREVDLILGGESLVKLSTLMWESWRKPVIVILCLSWIALNFLAQATIAMLSLNYSMDSGTDSKGIYTIDGTVKVARLDCYVAKGACATVPAVQMTTAHTYGELIRDQDPCQYTNDADIKNADQSCFYFQNNITGEYAYRYSEYNPSDPSLSYPYATNRNIRASSSQCYQYNIDWKNSPVVSGTDGDNDIRVFAFSNKTYSAHLPIPRSAGAYNGTTFVYNGTLAPQDAPFQSCGRRCVIIYALRLNSRGDGRLSNIYSCHVTVSEVFNATEDWHQLADGNAVLAGASIALTGRSTRPPKDVTHWQQYQLYNWGSSWNDYNPTPQTIGNKIAQFAIGSLGSMASINPKQQRPGTLPILGYSLNVQWGYVIALSVCIAVAHCLLVGVILWMARPVFVPDDSDLTTARLLHGLVGRLEGGGSLCDGKQLAATIQSLSDSKKGKIIYGIGQRHEGSEERVLGLRDGLRSKKDMEGKRFPEGPYA